MAGRTRREYNRRIKRKGAFWDDRYHATAVQTGSHLVRCLVYIDLNWEFGGYNEIQHQKQRYTPIDRKMLCHLLGIREDRALAETIKKWVEDSLSKGLSRRESRCTESIAMGDQSFVEETKESLGYWAQSNRERYRISTQRVA